MKRVLERLWTAEAVPPLRELTTRRITAVLDSTGEQRLYPSDYRVCRVYGQAPTARGRAVSFITQAMFEGETVAVCGPDSAEIATAYLRRVGIGKDDIGRPA